MRNHSLFSPTYWTGDTGRAIRSMKRNGETDHLTGKIGSYVMTAPGMSMIGLYYLPLPTLAHDMGCSTEEARESITRLEGVGFVQYDHDRSVIWVRNMARHQLGAALKPRDTKVVTVRRLWEPFAKTPLGVAFHRAYSSAYHMPDLPCDAPSDTPSNTPSDTPPDAPSDTHTMGSSKQPDGVFGSLPGDRDRDRDRDRGREGEGRPHPGAAHPDRAKATRPTEPVQMRAREDRAIAARPLADTPETEPWHAVLADLRFATPEGCDPIACTPSAARELVARLAEGYTAREMLELYSAYGRTINAGMDDRRWWGPSMFKPQRLEIVQNKVREHREKCEQEGAPAEVVDGRPVEPHEREAYAKGADALREYRRKIEDKSPWLKPTPSGPATSSPKRSA